MYIQLLLKLFCSIIDFAKFSYVSWHSEYLGTIDVVSVVFPTKAIEADPVEASGGTNLVAYNL